MKCAWHTYVSILPLWMRDAVNLADRENLMEIRLRLGQVPQMEFLHETRWLDRKVTRDDLSFVVNVASKYSPWAAETVGQGYITAPGGHRIGICGCAVVQDGKMKGIRLITSLNIRLSKDIYGISGEIYREPGSILIIGKPGAGKTTFLRDLIRQISKSENGCIAVIDEKAEIFPMANDNMCFPPGARTDVISSCNKEEGIHAVLRNMGPETIAVDEITAEEDCNALAHAAWCGVRLLATAHAANKRDLYSRTVYRPILESGVFQRLVVINPDKSWYSERL